MKLALALVSLLLASSVQADSPNQPLTPGDLPLPIILDPSQGDVPVTLDGEVVTVTGAVNATVSGSVDATIQEPLEVFQQKVSVPIDNWCMDGWNDRQDLSGGTYEGYDFIVNCRYLTELQVQTGGTADVAYTIAIDLHYYTEEGELRVKQLARFLHGSSLTDALQSFTVTFPHPIELPNALQQPEVVVNYYLSSWTPTGWLRSSVQLQGMKELP